eukprot:868430-Pleurochrysis_carterae.AAC.5
MKIKAHFKCVFIRTSASACDSTQHASADVLTFGTRPGASYDESDPKLTPPHGSSCNQSLACNFKLLTSPDRDCFAEARRSVPGLKLASRKKNGLVVLENWSKLTRCPAIDQCQQAMPRRWFFWPNVPTLAKLAYVTYWTAMLADLRTYILIENFGMLDRQYTLLSSTIYCRLVMI